MWLVPKGNQEDHNSLSFFLLVLVEFSFSLSLLQWLQSTSLHSPLNKHFVSSFIFFLFFLRATSYVVSTSATHTLFVLAPSLPNPYLPKEHILSVIPWPSDRQSWFCSVFSFHFWQRLSRRLETAGFWNQWYETLLINFVFSFSF